MRKEHGPVQVPLPALAVHSWPHTPWRRGSGNPLPSPWGFVAFRMSSLRGGPNRTGGRVTFLANAKDVAEIVKRWVRNSFVIG